MTSQVYKGQTIVPKSVQSVKGDWLPKGDIIDDNIIRNHSVCERSFPTKKEADDEFVKQAKNIIDKE